MISFSPSPQSSVIQGIDGTEISIVNVPICRPLVKSVYQNINFLIYQPKYILSSTANAPLQIINHSYFNIKYKGIKIGNNIVKSIEQVISKKNQKKIQNFHDFSICFAQGWFSKLKKSVSSVSTVRVYH